MNTSVPWTKGPCRPNDWSARHFPFAVLKVNETVGVERTDLMTEIGMPLLAMDSRHPKALDAPESLVHSSQYPLEIERSLAIVPETSSDECDVSDSECSCDEYVV